MNYEQKYKEALERAREDFNDENTSNYERRKLEKIFPELKQSEDKIFKELLYNLIVSNDYTPPSKEIFSIYGKTKEDCIAWLEKQGEQKSAWSEEDENMFNVILLDLADRREMFKFKGETKFAEDTQKEIDWLSSYYLQLKHQSSCPKPKQEWSEEDEENYKSLEKLLNESSCYSCTDGSKKLLNWLKSLKPQPRHE